MSKIQQQIEDWKKQYGGVYELPSDDKVAYLREPKMLDFKRAFTAMQSDGDLAFGETLLEALFIGGDREMLSNDDYFLPARKKLVNFFVFEDAEITQDGSNFIITIGEVKCTVRKIIRQDIKTAEKKNPSGKPFVTQEKLFDLICKEKDEAFNDKNNAAVRFPLYQAIEELQNSKVASIKKL